MVKYMTLSLKTMQHRNSLWETIWHKHTEFFDDKKLSYVDEKALKLFI